MDILKDNCRICLKQRTDLISIYNYHNSKYLPVVIYNISGVKILRKSEPHTKICVNCKNAIIIAEKIILRCQETEEFLQGDKIVDKEPNTHISNTQNQLSDSTVLNKLSETRLPNDNYDDDASRIISNHKTVTNSTTIDSSASNKMMLSCEKCDFQTKFTKILRSHRQREHKINDSNIFACSICFERFAWKASLFRHIECAHNKIPEEKKFPCDICGKAYIKMRHLEEHKQDSHEPRRFKCVEPGCQLTFTRAFTLRRHYLAVHDKTAPRYHCTDCNVHFKIYDLWKHHNKTAHKNLNLLNNKIKIKSHKN